MSALSQAVADYLAVRRALSYKLARPEKLLAQFTGYLEQAGAVTVTTEHARLDRPGKGVLRGQDSPQGIQTVRYLTPPESMCTGPGSRRHGLPGMSWRQKRIEGLFLPRGYILCSKFRVRLLLAVLSGRQPVA
jgi:hypothetical protein